MPGKIFPEGVVVQFSDGKKALLPLSCHKIANGLMKRYLSSPARTYGGPISLDGLEADHRKLLYQYFLKHYPNIVLRINPFDSPYDIEALKPSMADETCVLELSRNFDEIVHTWTKGHRSAVTKAMKAGITIRLAHSADDWKRYYDIYLSSFRRWGDKATSKYHWEFFKILSDLNTPYVKLWLAEFERQCVAGAVIFYARNHAVYGYAAALEEFFSMRPVNLLLFEVIKDASSRKFSWFDFNPSGGHEGVMKFKQSFGSQKMSCPIVDKQSFVLKNMEKLYKQWLLRFAKADKSPGGK